MNGSSTTLLPTARRKSSVGALTSVWAVAPSLNQRCDISTSPPHLIPSSLTRHLDPLEGLVHDIARHFELVDTQPRERLMLDEEGEVERG